ncbi:MAG: DUF1573 domain-containing protein [Bacteroidaceae bacterium]|nr:DUF1573 domain-containing protein [Bacteroidaceae bacterium]
MALTPLCSWPRLTFTLLISLLFALIANAQPSVRVDNPIVNVGDLLFQTPKQINFEIVNSGNAPLRITDVHPSCGCTSAIWPKQPVEPGQSAQIKATFDAAMLGTFYKDLAIYSNASDQPTYIAFQGRVVTTIDADYDGSYPVDLGVVRLNTNDIEFDNVKRGDLPVAQIMIVNSSRSSFTPQLMHLPRYLSARYLPEQLSGGRQGRIMITLDSNLLPSMGLHQTSIYLSRFPGDKVSPENEISVSALLLPNFTSYSEAQLAKAPVMELSADSLSFTNLGKKTRQQQVITIRNTGQTPLTVSRLQVYGKVLSVRLSSKTIKPGKSAKLKVIASQKYLKNNKTRPRVLLITNDPKRPKVVVNVKVKS